MNFNEANEYLINIPKFTLKNEPEKTKAFLDEIGDISIKIPTVHVAGTNGKGSVCAYLRAALMENGLKVGLFTSPHLVNITERFCINNEEISEREFANTFNYVFSLVEEMHNKPGFESYHPTFFEFLFFMSVVWFKSKRPDIIILETGLGGRLDATNSIERPILSVITEIGLDHCEYLGDTKEKIAFEKAGIIKEKTPVIAIDKGEAWIDVIKNTAKEKAAPLYTVSRENIKNLETFSHRVDFSFQSLYDEFVKIYLNTNSYYQVENSCIAYRALEILSHSLPNPLNMEKARFGLSKMYWPGRMEILPNGLTLDGAHNPDGIKAFLEAVKGDGACKRILLYSAVKDKSIEEIASLIKESNLFKKLYLCKLQGDRAADIKRLESAFFGIECVSFAETAEALGAMLKEAEAKLYAAGSLYLVGEIKALISEEEK